MLCEPKQEGTQIQFKIADDIIFYYQFNFETDKRGENCVKIAFNYRGSTKDEISTHAFNLILPQPKIILRNTIGAWARDQVWNSLYVSEQGSKTPYGEDCFVFPHLSQKARKLKSYVYLRSKKIGNVLGGIIWREWLDRAGMSVEDERDISYVAWKLHPHTSTKSKHHNIGNYETIWSIRKNNDPVFWNIFKSDMHKYHKSMCAWLVHSISRRKGCVVTLEEYNEIIKTTPALVRKCRYGFNWTVDEVSEYSLGYQLPNTRWQWFAFRVAGLEAARMAKYQHYNDNYEYGRTIEFCNKLVLSDISVWHCFKKFRHLKKPYSQKEINHVVRTVTDGARIYHNMRKNNYDVPVVPVEGSAMRMLRAAIFNHRQEQTIQKKERLNRPNHSLPQPAVKLPQWIEDIRIKDVHSMIEAGIECQHCIGSFTHSHDTFVREGDVCAQIYRHNLTIGQCYDVHDQITKKSESLRKRLNRALEPIREEMANVK